MPAISRAPHSYQPNEFWQPHAPLNGRVSQFALIHLRFLNRPSWRSAPMQAFKKRLGGEHLTRADHGAIVKLK